MSKRSSRHDATEYQQAARDPESTRRGLLWIPPIAVAVLSIPLLYLSIRFSLLATATMRNIVLLGSDLGVGITVGMYVFSAAGWLALAGTLVFLLLAVRAKTARWRIWFSVFALVCAGIAPACWLLLGWV